MVHRLAGAEPDIRREGGRGRVGAGPHSGQNLMHDAGSHCGEYRLDRLIERNML